MRSTAGGGGPFIGFPVGRPTAGAVYSTQLQNQGMPAAHYVPSGGVRALQAFLKNKGYNIQVDGIRGPQTEAAITAYHNGVTPKAWNTKSVHSTSKSTASPGSAAARAAAARTGHPAPPPRRTVAKNLPPNRPGTNPIAAAQAAQASADPTSLTIEQQAQQAANTLFDPQIAAINQQIAQARADAAAQQTALGNWYGQVGDTATAAAQQQAANDQALQTQQQQGQQNMLNLFGGPGANGSAGAAGAFADINNAALQQLSAANEAYASQEPNIVGLLGTDAKAGAQRDANAAIADLASQISQLQGQKAASYQDTLYKYKQDAYNAQQDSIKNAQAQQALDLANALAPAQIRTANAKASLAQTQAKNAPIQAARDAKMFGMSVARYKAEIAATNARTKKILADAKASSTNGQIDWNDPNTRASLAKQLRGIIQSKQGTWRMHPGAAQQNLNLALKQLGLSGNPNAIEIRNELLQETVTNSHAVRQWGQFNYANGKIVKTGQRFKPRKPAKK